MSLRSLFGYGKTEVADEKALAAAKAAAEEKEKAEAKRTELLNKIKADAEALQESFSIQKEVKLSERTKRIKTKLEGQKYVEVKTETKKIVQAQTTGFLAQLFSGKQEEKKTTPVDLKKKEALKKLAETVAQNAKKPTHLLVNETESRLAKVSSRILKNSPTVNKPAPQPTPKTIKWQQHLDKQAFHGLSQTVVGKVRVNPALSSHMFKIEKAKTTQTQAAIERKKELPAIKKSPEQLAQAEEFRGPSIR